MFSLINEININGDIQTTFHDFTITQTGMNISISNGSYYRGGNLLFHSDTGGTLTLSSSQYQDLYTEIWLATTGIEVLQGGDIVDVFENNPIPVANRIDRLGWLTIPMGSTSLDAVQIDVVKVVALQ